MGEQNLPQLTSATPIKTQLVTAPLKWQPIAANALGAGMLVAGAAGVFIVGIGLLPLAAIAAGASILIGYRLLRKPSHSLVDAAYRLESQRKAALTELKRYIAKTRYLEHVGDLGEKAATQWEQIDGRFEAFQKMLALKFDPGEITYARYFSAAERAFLAVVENLRQTAGMLYNVDAIAPVEVAEQANDGTALALRERAALRQRQIVLVEANLSFGEKALTEFDRVGAALSEIKTQRGLSDADLDGVMAELAELAERAKKYSVS